MTSKPSTVRRAMIRTACASGVVFSLTGCATMVHGSTQRVSMSSEPAGATVFVDNRHVGVTPLAAGKAVDRLSDLNGLHLDVVVVADMGSWTLTGRFIHASDSDLVVMGADEQSVTVPVASIATVSRIERTPLRGLLIGYAVGAAGAVMTGQATRDPRPGILLEVAGTSIGALQGYRHQRQVVLYRAPKGRR